MFKNRNVCETLKGKNMLNSQKDTSTYKIGLMSTNKILFMIVSCLLKINDSNKRQYIVEETNDEQMSNKEPVDILFIDVDNFNKRQQVNSSIPTIILSEEKESTNYYSGNNIYMLQRKKLSTRLLKTLNKIITKNFDKPSNVNIVAEPTKLAGSIKSETKNNIRTLPKSTNGRVLVIDDSLTVRTQMTMVLDRYNLDVDLAEDAESAFSQIYHKDYDLIFLDIVLPEMNGYQACKILKSKKWAKNTPVVMLTGKTSSFSKIQGFMSGCDKYLTKPVKADLLHNVLLKHIPILSMRMKS